MGSVLLTDLGLSRDDLSAIGKLSEKGMTPEQIANAVEKAGQINSSASEIDDTVSKFVEIKVMTAAEYALITPVSTILYFIKDL